MWLSCKLFAVSVADFGHWTLNLPSTEAWSPLKEDLPHPSWAKTIFNERPGAIPLANANYGRNPFRWLVGKGWFRGVFAFRCVEATLETETRTHAQKKNVTCHWISPLGVEGCHTFEETKTWFRVRSVRYGTHE